MAIHESAHAVIGTKEDADLIRVTIDPADPDGPHARFWFLGPENDDYSNLEGFDPDDPPNADERALLESQIRIWKAGCVAEAYLISSDTASDVAHYTNCEPDNLRIRWALGELSDDPGERVDIDAAAVEAATAAVAECWQSIVRVAQDLVVAGELSGDEVRELLSNPAEPS
jgi:hypothetical protein